MFSFRQDDSFVNWLQAYNKVLETKKGRNMKSSSVWRTLQNLKMLFQNETSPKGVINKYAFYV